MDHSFISIIIPVYPTMPFNFRNTQQGFLTELSDQKQKTTTHVKPDFADHMKRIISMIPIKPSISQTETAIQSGISKRTVS